LNIFVLLISDKKCYVCDNGRMMWSPACSLTFRWTVALCCMLHFIISRNERISMSCFTADYIGVLY